MSDKNVSWTTTATGWFVVCCIAAAVAYKYLYIDQRSIAALQGKEQRVRVEPKKTNRAKKQRSEAFAQVSHKLTTAAEKLSTTLTGEEPATTTTRPSKRGSDDDGVDNQDFARRLASVKEGTKFGGKSNNAGNNNQQTRQKSVKQSQAAKQKQPEPEEIKPSAPSSTAGIDADDDQSSAASPEVAAADASGVRDMLEPTLAGPSVLRLTDTDKTKTKPKVTKAPEQTETKKQRQNRKKNEAAKAQREEDEKQRKVLLEKQRRTAREAAGIAAKDGSQFMASVNGTKSAAWDAGAPQGATGSAPVSNGGFVPVQPLDTFDAPSSKGSKGSTTAKSTDGSWMSSLPSEEEQIELLKSETEEWNTVKGKTTKKPKKESSSAEEVPALAAPKSSSAPAPQAAIKSQTTKAAVNGKPTKPTPVSYGSFSALSTKDSEVEEQEWDV